MAVKVWAWKNQRNWRKYDIDGCLVGLEKKIGFEECEKLKLRVIVDKRFCKFEEKQQKEK